MRRSIVTFALTIAFAVTAVTASIDLRDCMELPAAERVACAERRADEGALESKDLRELDPLIERDPGGALELLAILERRAGENTGLRAEILDLQAKAFGVRGDTERAAERATDALATDAGVRSLEWWSPEGGRLWSAPLDSVSERHVVAAKALVAVGRDEEARSLLGAAMRLGKGGETERLWDEVGAGPVDGLDAAPSPIVARPWFPRLPLLAVPIIGSEPFPLADARGDVLILDFWASWCEPCLRELPAIGRLYESERENGLRVIIVNMAESPEHAENFARDLGLEMPIGRYDDALEEAFDARSLPTVIVADRQGRVRARFDGYRYGLEEEIAALARDLLPLHGEPPGEPIGEVLRGGGLLEVEWARDVAGEVDGLVMASVDGPDSDPALVALAGRHALIYDWRGAVAGFVDRPPGSGAIRRGDLDGDGHDELFSFRVGGTRYNRLDLDRGEHESRESPAPLLDLALLPHAAGRRETVALATVSGLFRAGTDGSPESIPGFAAPTGVLGVDSAAGRRLGVIGERGFCTLDPLAPEDASCLADRRGSRLVAGADGAGTGIVPRGVAAIVGRILGGPQGEIAAITSTGQLVILDIASGAERFRARLEDPRAIAAGDIDADGLDELVVGVGRRVVLLRKSGTTTPRSHSDQQEEHNPRPEEIDSPKTDRDDSAAVHHWEVEHDLARY